MAVEQQIYDIGILKAYTNLSDRQFHFMKLTGTDFEFTSAIEGTAPVGILQNKPAAAGRVGQIRRVGISKLVLGEEVVAGQKLKPDDNGHGIVADTDKDAYGAVALEAGSEYDTVTVLMEFGYIAV